jgi:hypothetical protein
MMADDTTPLTPPPTDLLSQLGPLLQQLQLGQPQDVPRDNTPVERSWQSKLGEKLAGPLVMQGMTPAEREAAGVAALGHFGTGLLNASGHMQGGTFGTLLGAGFQGAEQGQLGYEQGVASNLAARQEYQQKQQEMRIAALKEALPLLRMQQGANIPNTLLGTQTTPAGGGTNIATGGSIAAPLLARDTSMTAGQQANNSGNLMMAPGAPAPAGAIGAVPVSGGRYVAAFPDAATGIAAQSDNLTAYQTQHGENTIRGAVRRWVSDPSIPQGDPKGVLTSYTNDIAKLAGVDPDAKVDLSDPKIQRAFFIAQQPHESGKAWLKPEDVDKGLAIAAARRGGGTQAATPPAAPTVQTPPAPAPRAPVGTPADALPAGGATVAGPAGTATVGAPRPPGPAVPGDVNAIIAGMTGAGANAATLAAGGAQSAPQAPAQVATTAPVVPQTTTTTPPAVTPGGRMTPEQYQALHPITIDPATYTVTPPNLDALISSRNQAKTQLDLANRGLGGDPNKSLSDYNTAAKAVTDAQAAAAAKSVELRQAAVDKANQIQATNYNEEMKRVDAIEEAEKQRAAAAALETQRGQQSIDLEKVKAGQTWHQKLQEQAAQYAQTNTLQPMSAQAAKSHQMNMGLAQLLPVLQDLPKGGGALGSVLDAHPDLAPLFNTAGILTDKSADAVRLVNGLVSNISTEMKPTGLGALREYEWDAFKAQLPSMLSTPAGQQKAVAMLMNMNNRIADEHSWMSNYFSRKVPDETTPGKMVPAHNLESDDPKESVQQRMDRELGPIIPSYSGAPSGSGQAQWEQSLAPGKPYYKTWAVPDPKNPGQPRRDSRGNVMTTKTLEIRPWQ